ncbi:MAG: ABC transporter substrate-binding protein [Clostridia bacterium]|nr:ABC transporter substrate-binding protein [Clostridia bacterium]
MKNARSHRLAAAAVALLMLAAQALGCTQTDPGQTGSPDPSTLVLPTPTPQVVPLSGGELTMYMLRNAMSADPLDVNTEEVLSLYSLVCESLVELDESGMLAPCLSSAWQRSETDANTWIFTLRDNVTWHSGEAFTAADVASTVELIRERGADCYFYPYIEDIISCSYDAGEPYTLRITFAHSGLSAVKKLVFPIVKTDSLEGESPIGTGPYAVVSVSDESVRLDANDAWWRRAPYITTVRYLVRDSEEIALNSLSAGQLNFMPTSVLYSGSYREEGRLNVMDVLTQNMEVLLFNRDSGPLRSVDVRRAIAFSIDRSQIISYVYMNKAHECDVPIAPDSYAYDGSYKVYDYNRNQAIVLFDAAGYSDTDGDGKLENVSTGTELTLRLLVNTVRENTIRVDAARYIADQLAEIGVTVEIVEAEYEADGGGEYARMLRDGEFDIALMGVNTPRYLDLRAVLSSDGELNYGGYASQEMDELVDALYLAQDDAQVRSAAALLMEKFTDELPFMVMYFRMNSIIYTDQLMGLNAARKPDILRNIENWYMYAE